MGIVTWLSVLKDTTRRKDDWHDTVVEFSKIRLTVTVVIGAASLDLVKEGF